MAGVKSAPADAVVAGQADGGCRDEPRNLQLLDAEETQHWRRAVEVAESAAEARVGAPALAHEGGADEELGFLRREAEEDLSNEIIHQCRFNQLDRRLRQLGPRRSETVIALHICL